MDVVQLIFSFSTDFDNIPKAFRRDQACYGALTFDQGVGEKRCRVDDTGDVSWGNAILIDDLADAI